MTITTESAPPPEGAPDPTTTARPKLPLLLAVVGVVVLAAVAWFVFLRDDDSGSSKLPEGSGQPGTIPPAAEAPPDAEGKALEQMIEKGRKLTFHAVYTATGDPAKLGGELTMEVWRANGKSRQDTRVVTSAATARTAGIVDGDKVYSCEKRDEAPWTCSSAPNADTNEAGIFGSVAAQLEGVDVKEEQATVAGREARCFTFDTGGGPGKECFAKDGTPLLISAGGQELVLTDLDKNVDANVFAPPAAT